MKKNKPVYLQMASFGMSGSTLTFSDQLCAAARIGFAGIELAKPDFGGITAAQLKCLVKELHLEVLSAHIPLEQMMNAVKDMQLLGVRYFVVPNAMLNGRDDALRLAEHLNQLGDELKQEGIALGYHNHNPEFKMDDGEYLLQTLIDYTNPELVFFEYDVGWAAASGIDYLEFFKQNAGRIRLLHANESNAVLGPGIGRQPQQIPILPDGTRDYTPEEAAYQIQRKICDCRMGEGIPDWQAIREVEHVDAYIVERRYNYRDNPVDCFAEDFQFVQKLLYD